MIYIKEAARSLWATKQRSILALVGIVIGIGSVISLVSIGQIVANEATREFRSLGTDIVTLTIDPKKGRAIPDLIKQPAFYTGLVGHTRCVLESAPYSEYQVSLQNRIEAAESEVISGLGVSVEFQNVGRLELSAGRFLSPLDLERPYVVLGAKIAGFMGLRESPEVLIGKQIDIDGELLDIVGVLEHASPLGAISVSPDVTVFTPILRGVVRGQGFGFLRTALVRMKPDVDPEVCVSEIEDYILLRLPDANVEVVSATELIAQMRAQADLLGILLAAVGSISLVVGGVGIMNIMLVSVTERKQEIGIRRAIGARRKDIRYQFLIESLLLSIIGGILGILSSIVITWLVCNSFGWEFLVSMGSILLGAGVSILIGVFFGYMPAHQAANLDPIESLHGNG